jgi:predicted type IV restriction endonuclease
MKHEKEIDELLKDLFYDETWMDDEDYEECLELIFSLTELSKQKISDDIEIGIKNGWSLEKQIRVLKEQIQKDIKSYE